MSIDFQLYDLHTSKNHPGENHQNGCQREDAICGRASINSVSKCGQHGTCEMVNWYDNDVQCVCNPGYRPADKNSIRCQLGKCELSEKYSINKLVLWMYLFLWVPSFLNLGKEICLLILDFITFRIETLQTYQ